MLRIVEIWLEMLATTHATGLWQSRREISLRDFKNSHFSKGRGASVIRVSEMAETKEHNDLPDCEYQGMLEFLRYIVIYTDEVCLNGKNDMQVLHLAEKYMISSLTSKCIEYHRKERIWIYQMCFVS